MRGVLGRADVEDLPFEIVIQRLQAFEGDFEGKWGEELGGVVEDDLWIATGVGGRECPRIHFVVGKFFMQGE